MGKLLFTAAGIAALCAVSASAQGLEIDNAGRELAGTIFASTDTDGSGMLSPEEVQAFGELVFVSVDIDDDGAFSVEEFRAWGFGFAELAQEQGRDNEFQVAHRIVFDLWDRDNDLAINRAEFDQGRKWSFVYSDLDGDSQVTEEEFLLGYLPNIAYRAVLGPR